jgi:PBSX family phage terminase large subunit
MGAKLQKAAIQFKPFSIKQKQVLTWWTPSSPHHDKDILICDGAIRSGKTIIMSLSYSIWAMSSYNHTNFGMAGKTIDSFKRNVWFWLKPMLVSRGYTISKRADIGDNVWAFTKGDITNYFYFFGGRDESSQDLVQGITLGGFFLDEVVLMPESFVNQCKARCSVEGAKIWFNCNPEGPYHWFKTDYIDRIKELNALRIHFELDDNPSLSEKVKQRYMRMFSGVFFKRFVLGLWVLSEGLIYDSLDDEENVWDDDELERLLVESNQVQRFISIDYGTSNPMVFGDCYDDGTTVYVRDEYYYSGRATGKQKTDSQYADDFDAFVKAVDKDPVFVIVDPSAASFKAELRLRGYLVRDADNDVEDGIRMVQNMLGLRLLKIHKRCKKGLGEMYSYIWDVKASKRGKELPVKDNDHFPDMLRYMVKTLIPSWRLNKDEQEAA